ncbi:hypothetical protein Hanom_Chr16g01501681 [Helianthus anomalus]
MCVVCICVCERDFVFLCPSSSSPPCRSRCRRSAGNGFVARRRPTTSLAEPHTEWSQEI